MSGKRQPAGGEVVARWREAGEWWAGDPYREVTRTIQPNGAVKETIACYESLGNLRTGDKPLLDEQEDHSEEWSLRIHKVRDEKVSRAMGLVKEPTVHKRTKQLSYAPLHVASGYSFGRGTILAQELAPLAAAAGFPACAITDRFSLVGVVEFARMAKQVGIKPLIGATIEIPEGGELVLIAKSKSGYESLSQLITECLLHEPRLYPLATWGRLQHYSRDLICLTGGEEGPLNRLISNGNLSEANRLVENLKDCFGASNVFIEIERSYLPWELKTNRLLDELASTHGLTTVAGGIVTHARPQHYPAQDSLVCIDTLCTVEEIIGRKPRRADGQPQATSRPERALNAERYLRSSAEMRHLFSDRVDLLENTMRVVDRCDDDVLPSRTQLPDLVDNPNHVIRELTYIGAFERHRQVGKSLRKRLDYELDRIIRLNFAPHFLTIWDVCRWSREQAILFSGRGSVVDSAVAYCLGLSRIDAFEHRLHFDRFLPEDGSKRPDIDIDFEAKRRNDVRKYMTSKYGQEHVATVSAIGAYCTRGIVREVGKILGLPQETIGFLAKRLHGSVSAKSLEAALSNRPELRNSNIPSERFQWVFELAERMMDIPRNIRAHSSGVVISSRPLAETVPVMWSGAGSEWNEDFIRIIQWDKRSAKHYFDKFDILCLRGQDVLGGTQERIRVESKNFDVQQIPLNDEETYRAMRSGALIGIPQSASPAMRQAHVRLRTENLHDASLVQAGIRPGVGGAVKINELIARRRGKPYSFEHPELERILGLTYGIIVFQEQVDQLLQTFCGFTSGEAEQIREQIHEKRRQNFGESLQDVILKRIVDNGFSQRVAEQVFDYVSGFKGYGFAQGHALAFAEISIRSIYCQQNFPAQYFASLLDAQPAGYYGPCTLVNEARNRGVAILPACVLASALNFTVEDIKSAVDPKIVLPSAGIRVALTEISGVSRAMLEQIVSKRPYDTVDEFVVRVNPNRDDLERLILCGALDRLYPNRRELLWRVPEFLGYAKASRSAPVLPFEYAQEGSEPIEDFSYPEKAVYERSILGLDVEHHLMAFERERVASRGGITSAEASRLEPGRKAIVVGNPIRLRFPPTQSGKRVVFFDLEDESGLLNVTCFDDTYQKDGHAIICSPYVTLIGEAQDRDGHTAFLAHRVFPYRPSLSTLPSSEALPIKTADFLVG